MNPHRTIIGATHLNQLSLMMILVGCVRTRLYESSTNNYRRYAPQSIISNDDFSRVRQNQAI
ncbi:hypothetical protein [Limnospira platensis]|uniref:hypothetical protein n=1 Tax=Limnospira platensis TaxID=118562 RepID=UPI0001D0EA66|nr:hypothetical protein [Arthrospira platensis NCB002]QQW28134.1 hypothetical protein AP9108_24080 [Arthrospira sp. PCC 9108]BAI92805.1 hypothetical protein NIES39_L06480 [Arthrospira platensis NIES-39]